MMVLVDNFLCVFFFYFFFFFFFCFSVAICDLAHNVEAIFCLP